MMSLIRLGDTTDDGGEVVTAAETCSTAGGVWPARATRYLVLAILT
jgi:uncharacterized Zn-binding protein involved in type VI secretion